MATSETKRPSRRFDLSFRPESYWTETKRPGQRAAMPEMEAEIARIVVSSGARDCISLRARHSASGRILYRMVHEDAEGPSNRRIRLKKALTDAPLTFGELIELLETACYAAPCPDEGDDERYGGVIWGTVALNLEHGLDHADDYLFHLKVTSAHYPDLEAYYDARLSEWCLANCVEEEDCGKTVRLRRGRFPRRLVGV